MSRNVVRKKESSNSLQVAKAWALNYSYYHIKIIINNSRTTRKGYEEV